MILLDGKALSDKRGAELREKFAALSEKARLAIVRVGTVPESEVYIKRKAAFGESINVEVKIIELPENISEIALIEEIQKLNSDTSTHGIILQLPIPKNLNREKVLNTISPEKDVDGITAINMWRLMDTTPNLIPATALGVCTLLEAYNLPIEGKHVVVVGDSLLVGKPTALYFLHKEATVTVCHDKTQNLANFTKQADILVVAVGKPDLITKDHVHPAQIVIDVGINKLEKGNLVGDVSYDEVKEVVAAITPVPGGVGPMTVVSLFENLLKAIQTGHSN